MILYSAARWVYHRLFRVYVRLGCFCADVFESRNEGTSAIPPALLRFKVSELYSAREFIRIGYGCAERLANQIGESGIDLDRRSRILDFGCGCGRTITWLMRKYPEVEFHGVDVDPDAITWCSRHLPRGRFMVNGALPPLVYPDAHFDVVYCFSVFTHLNEKMQDSWLTELNRVLRSGGLLVITVHGRNAAKGLSAADLNTLDTIGFLHKTSTKLGGIMPTWYQTTWHSRRYIEDRLRRWFGDICYCEIDDGVQDFVMGRAKR